MSYANVHDSTSQSRDWARLYKENARAGMIYVTSWAHCDPYAILPGEPMVFMGKVCPLFGLTEAAAVKVLAYLEAAGFIHQYEVDGRRYIYLLNWHEYQTVKWERVGAPAHPLPDCWVLPPRLQECLEAGMGRKAMRAYFSQSASSIPDPPSPCHAPVQDSPGPVRDQSGPCHSSGNTQTQTQTQTQSKGKAVAPAAATVPKELTPQQQIIAEAWEAHELGPLPKKCRGYSGLVALVQTKGLPLVQEWIAHVQRAAPRPPEGAEAWKWFCDSFRGAVNRPWEWQRGETRAGRGLPGKPHEYAGGRVNDW